MLSLQQVPVIQSDRQDNSSQQSNVPFSTSVLQTPAVQQGQSQQADPQVLIITLKQFSYNL